MPSGIYIHKNNKISKKCLVCGKEFLVKPYMFKNAKFCSSICYGKSIKGKPGNWLGKKRPDMTGKNHPHWNHSIVDKECLICKKPISRKNLTGNAGKFCSKECGYKWVSLNINGINHHNWRGGRPKCKKCDKIIGYHRKNCLFCSLSKKGKENRNWKGGMVKDVFGYKYIYNPTHPNISKNGRYIAEHRLIAEKCLGRYLDRKEIIHHINRIKDDNRPENLYLFPNNVVHRKYHTKPYQLTSNII